MGGARIEAGGSSRRYRVVGMFPYRFFGIDEAVNYNKASVAMSLRMPRPRIFTPIVVGGQVSNSEPSLNFSRMAVTVQLRIVARNV